MVLLVKRRRRLVTFALPPRGEHGGCRLPDFDYATNVRAAGELYHTGAVFLALLFGNGHALPGGLVNVFFGFDVHLEGHGAK